MTKFEIEKQLAAETNPSVREILENHLKRFKDVAPTTTETPAKTEVVFEAPVEKKARK